MLDPHMFTHTENPGRICSLNLISGVCFSDQDTSQPKGLDVCHLITCDNDIVCVSKGVMYVIAHA